MKICESIVAVFNTYYILYTIADADTNSSALNICPANAYRSRPTFGDETFDIISRNGTAGLFIESIFKPRTDELLAYNISPAAINVCIVVISN